MMYIRALLGYYAGIKRKKVGSLTATKPKGAYTEPWAARGLPLNPPPFYFKDGRKSIMEENSMKYIAFVLRNIFYTALYCVIIFPVISAEGWADLLIGKGF